MLNDEPADARRVRVVVFGANGRSGRLIVDRLLAAGHEVTAAVRNPAGYPGAALSSPGGPVAHVRQADVRDVDGVRDAVSGQDVVVSAIGSGRESTGLHEAGAHSLVAAMTDAGIERLIVLSSSGAPLNDRSIPFLYRSIIRPLFFGEVYADVRAMEEVVRASTLNWTLVRPARLTDHAPTGTYRVVDGANPPRGRKITRSDLADFVAGSLGPDAWSRMTPSLAQ